MSNQALFTQANHTLTLIGQKNPTQEHLKRLHDGLLSDLLEAIMTGTITNRETFRTSIGLPSLQPVTVPEPELVLDPIIRVDRSIRPSYPDWVKTVMHPELENTGPAEYDITKMQWLHEGQKDEKWIEGSKIYTHLKDTGDLKSHCGLRDLEEIQKKGIIFFRKHFAGKTVFGWSSVVQDLDGDLYVLYLYESDGKVVLNWSWLCHDWRSDNPGLRHASK